MMVFWTFCIKGFVFHIVPAFQALLLFNYDQKNYKRRRNRISLYFCCACEANDFPCVELTQ